MVAAASSYRVTGSAEDADPCMYAGQDVEVSLAARDAYGNAIVDMDPVALRATATGCECAVQFQAVEVKPPSACLPSKAYSPHSPWQWLAGGCLLHGGKG
jgi:hypothetical protein